MRVLLRRWRQRPASIVSAIAIVALGVAANASLFGVLYAAVLAPLPYPAADRLFVIQDRNAARPGETRFAPGRFQDFAHRLHPVAALAAIWPGLAFNSSDEHGAIRLSGQFVTANVLDVLGRRVARGRAFTEGDMQPSAPAVALISDGLWRRRYGQRADVVGQTIRVDARVCDIVGVLPADVPLPADAADVWLPLQLGVWNRVSQNLVVVGRRAGNADEAAIARAIDATQQALAEAYPDTDTGSTPYPLSLGDVLAGDTRTPLSLVWIGSGLVLTLVSFNLGVLLVARATAQRQEIAIRRALGASTADVVVPAVGEAAMVAACGAVVGTGAAWRALPVVTSLVASVTHATGLASGAALAWPILTASVIAAVGTAAIAASIPSILIARIAPFDALRARHHGGGRTARRTLVAAEVAGAVVLVSLAALVTDTVWRLRAIDLGIRPANVMTARVVVPADAAGASARRRAIVADWLDRLRLLPGLEAAAVGSALPFGGSPAPFNVWFARSPGPIQTEHRSVTSGYFDALGIRVLAGRAFADADREETAPVAIVSAALARAMLDDAAAADWTRAVGQWISIDGPSGRRRSVIGVVDDTRYAGIARTSRRSELYLPWAQDPWPQMTLVVRQAPGRGIQGGELSRTLAAIDATLPVFDVAPLASRIDASIAVQILLERSFVAFAALAILIAAFGVYGLLAWVVEARRFELGVRVALGARPLVVAGLVLRELGALTIGGAMGGAVVAAVSAQWLAARVPDLVGLRSLVAIWSAFAVLTVVALAALPAVRRAVGTNPASVLRAS